MRPLPQVPLDSVSCESLLHHGRRYECLHGGECGQAMVDISKLVECSRTVDGKRAFTPARRAGQKFSASPTPSMVNAPPKATPKVLPCGYRKGWTGKKVKCGSCGGAEMNIFGCSVFGECSPAADVPGYQRCDGCFRRAPDPITPKLSTQVRLPACEREDGHGSHYNPSIIEWQGKTLFASRLGWAGSSVWLCELDADYQPIDGTLRELPISHWRAQQGVEDPRFFVWRGRLHLSVTGYDATTKGSTSIFIVQLSEALQVSNVWIPTYDKRRSWEKNWQFFEYAGDLHCVYEIAHDHHHVILKFDGDKGTEVARTKHSFHWTGAAMRGGASPLRIGGEFYSFFHSFVHDRRGLSVYGMGLYTFSAAPPFQVVRTIPGALLVPDSEVKGWNKSVVYPCGAMLRGDRFVISYGVHDRECRVVEFDRAEVEARLQ